MSRLARLGRFGTGLAAGLSLLYYAEAVSAAPSLEVSTTLGGSDANEYLVRVSNQDADAKDESGVLELRRQGDERTVARTHFEVPAHTTRYFRVPGDRGMRFGAVAITPGREKPIRALERYTNDSGSIVLFDIPPRDEQRLHELRVHNATTSAVITHASWDESTKTPVLTRRAAVYEGATLVLVPSSVFLALPAPEREALTNWVRAGGSMAVTITSEQDRALFTDGELGLGRMHVLSYDPWSPESNGNVDIQEKLVRLAQADRNDNRAYNDPWGKTPEASLDPNFGYRGVLPIAGVMLVIQALVTALAFRRLATRKGMGAGYRFVAASSAVGFAAVVGLGIYAKGGYGARARELSFAQAASGESVAWVQRNRAYFASRGRTIEVTPRDPANVIDSEGLGRYSSDSRATLRVEDANVVLGNVEIRPWQTTTVTEKGTTNLGGGVTVGFGDDGKVVVRNRVGAALHNVVVARPDGICVAFGDVANGEEKTSATPHSCTDLGPDWVNHRSSYPYPRRLTLLGELEEPPTTIDGFRLEKRTTLLHVTGGAS